MHQRSTSLPRDSCYSFQFRCTLLSFGFWITIHNYLYLLCFCRVRHFRIWYYTRFYCLLLKYNHWSWKGNWLIKGKGNFGIWLTKTCYETMEVDIVRVLDTFWQNHTSGWVDEIALVLFSTPTLLAVHSCLAGYFRLFIFKNAQPSRPNMVVGACEKI